MCYDNMKCFGSLPILMNSEDETLHMNTND